MVNASIQVARPANEKVLMYGPGTPEREAVKSAIKSMTESTIEIPLIIGGKEVRTGRTAKCVMPHKHGHVLATYHMAGEEEVRAAIEAALKAKAEWESTPWEHRMFVFRKASELLSGPWRATLNAATMLGQSKTVYQAEIDSACELTDFFRFNCYYASEISRPPPPTLTTATTTVRLRALSLRLRRSTSLPLRETWRRRLPSWGTPSCGNPRHPPCTLPIT